mmetsp:Transcript_69967/g.164648  ORF Transcript_69967/g.164648 Transcript_69967/m.164648 type:complete len:275 (+) Transcript_69967:89-913(+)
MHHLSRWLLFHWRRRRRLFPLRNGHVLSLRRQRLHDLCRRLRFDRRPVCLHPVRWWRLCSSWVGAVQPVLCWNVLRGRCFCMHQLSGRDVLRRWSIFLHPVPGGLLFPWRPADVQSLLRGNLLVARIVGLLDLSEQHVQRGGGFELHTVPSGRVFLVRILVLSSFRLQQPRSSSQPHLRPDLSASSLPDLRASPVPDLPTSTTDPCAYPCSDACSDTWPHSHPRRRRSPQRGSDRLPRGRHQRVLLRVSRSWQAPTPFQRQRSLAWRRGGLPDE